MFDKMCKLNERNTGHHIRYMTLRGGINTSQSRAMARGCAIATLLFAMVGCGADDGSSSDSGVSPPSPPANELSAVNAFSVVRPGSSTRVDLSNYVRGSDATLVAISSQQPDCISAKASGLSVEITSDSGLCEFSYTISGQGQEASAKLNTLASTSASPVLPPLSQTMTLAEPNKVFDLVALLGSDWPAGYSLDPDSLLVQGGSAQGTVTAAANNIIYTPPSATEPVWNQILFVLTDPANPDQDVMGSLFVTVSDSGNRSPAIGESRYDYNARTGNAVNTMQPVTLDLGTLPGLNVTDPDGDEWQLVDVQSYSATAEPVNPLSVSNKKILFEAAVPGDHIVSYIVGDDRAGFSMGLIKINVGLAESVKTWNNITIGEKTFQATPVYSEVINSGVIAEAVYDDGVANYVAGVTGVGAQAYCRNGSHWANLDELNLLRTTPEADIERAKYPVERTYVTYNGSGQLVTFELRTGATAPYYQATSPTQYVICVTESAMSYSPRVTAYGTDTGLSDSTWWSLGTLLSDGGANDPIVTASTNIGSTPLTDANVQLNPPGCPLGFCTVEVKGDATTYGNVTIQVANAVTPTKTIDIGPLTLLQSAKVSAASVGNNNSLANGSSANTVVVSVVDATGSPLPNTAVKLQYSAPAGVNVSPASCVDATTCIPVTTDGSGNITLSLTTTTEGSYAVNLATNALVGGVPGNAVTATSTFVRPGPNFGAGCTKGLVTIPGGLTYTCPLTQAEAEANGISYSGILSENGVVYVGHTWPKARDYCNGLGGGYRLPTLDELNALYSAYGNMTSYAGWPTGNYYWSSTEGIPGAHYNVSLGSGFVTSSYDSIKRFVTCVR
ncbi:hypothetical protein C3737_22110 [Aeromonas jandaei]|uniref:adhesion domain-containing protein n=1 Tax=Aeromonas jandaei TaxID=650 RepID=UPI000CE216BC|nr:DUF823 domain-containing adhesin [Aeromonas jandaei]PPA27884.1 hypothetical protein C3737_22110 [Aeromonas jandaei]